MTLLAFVAIAMIGSIALEPISIMIVVLRLPSTRFQKPAHFPLNLGLAWPGLLGHLSPLFTDHT